MGDPSATSPEGRTLTYHVVRDMGLYLTVRVMQTTVGTEGNR